MNYELAKQLKEAGFKWDETLEEVRFHNDNLTRIGKTEPIFIDAYMDIPEKYKERILDGDDGWFYAPTLSELIDACGDKFGALKPLDSLENQGFNISIGWKAESKKWETENINQYGEKQGGIANYFGEGKTPEEAVAKLWLKLSV
jgi:hypothetical protein